MRERDVMRGFFLLRFFCGCFGIGFSARCIYVLRSTGVLVGIELVLHACIRAMELDAEMQRGRN
jgi:uncharacterized membrane protein